MPPKRRGDHVHRVDPLAIWVAISHLSAEMIATRATVTPRASVRAQASKKALSQTLVATAAALLIASPAVAGVQFVQPEKNTKKAFQVS